ncbi:uncharacterized protein LOC141655039 [Silene latifolia]|uniref:uncharacterized protein LOC141655039 n=1 Tax=Silene latifolia TaxID=37657 RepID=UPI003D7788A8
MKVIELEENKWKLVMRSGFHNHALTLYCDGDRYFAKFDEEELAYIDAQVRAHVRPAIISTGLHQRNPEKSRPNRRQIYNRSQKVRAEERDGKNTAQQMSALAVQHKYVHYWVTDQETDELTHVFMAHPEAVKMFRSYYYVVLIDSTYKTNLYRLPLVEMVGVTPIGKSFVIAYALVTHESEDGYLWVLRKLKALLNDVVQSNAIVTDCEAGLLNAIPIVFPDSSHLLCLWHIYSNVETKALDITGQDSWAKHITCDLFEAVVEAETEDKFNVAWGNLARNGSRVPVDVLHAFWRKLEYDGSEAMPVCDDDRLEELFDEIRNADPSMRSSMFDVLYSQIHPEEEDVNEPRYPRSTQTGPDTPSTNATTSTGSFGTSYCAPLEVDYTIGHSRYFSYLHFLPSWFHEYLEAWFNPSGDGHCGFRVLSHAVRGDQSHFTMARTDLLREICSPIYRDHIYGPGRFDTEVARITFMDQIPCDSGHWMDSFNLYGYATMYNWVICCIYSFDDQEGHRHWNGSEYFQKCMNLHQFLCIQEI